jgi:nicotinate-nucleotide adenylyltransferase
MNSSPVRLGLFGGTFNPIHLGHLRAAEEITELMELKNILFIPSASPPHKNNQPLIEFSHRFEMVRLAISDRPGFSVSDMEARREGLSYTVDSLRQLHASHDGSLDAYFVVGDEAFMEMPTWKEYRELLALTNFVIINRARYDAKKAERLLTEKVSPDFTWDPVQKAFTCPGKGNVFYRDVTRLDISSTGIRERLARGASIRYLVPEPVRVYIKENNLYQTNEVN